MQLTKGEEPRAPAQWMGPERRRRVRRTTLIVTGVALFFYFGFIILMLFRAYRATH